jgi:ABC-type uncharacterized transport system permease subunit
MHVRTGRFRLYAAVAQSAFRRYATYRIATAAGVFTNTVFGLILAYTYIALWDERPGLGGYDQAQAVTYVWLGQALLTVMALMGGGFEAELIERIRTGDIAVDLYRPADLQAWWLATDAGRGLFQLLGRGVAPMAVGAVVFDLALPTEPLRWLAFAVAVVLGVLVSFAIRFLVALSAFWLMDGAGVTQVAMRRAGRGRPRAALVGAAPAPRRRLPRHEQRHGPHRYVRLPARLGGGAARGRAAAPGGRDAPGGGPGWLNRCGRPRRPNRRGCVTGCGPTG